jgi:uncharacterized repeat protein (TIGR02059 family)
MKKFLIITFIFISIAVNAKNYYVKSTGNNNNTGLSNAQAWETISKVNASSFSPGDTIFFNKGDTWRETLIIPSSGSAGQPIVFFSYGTGNKPIIQPTTQVTSWTQVGATDVWYGTLTTSPTEVFIGDVYCQPAHWPTEVGSETPIFQTPSGNSADATHLTDVDLNGIAEANLIGAKVNIYTNGYTQKGSVIEAFDDATDILTTATVVTSPDTTMRYYLTAPAGAGILFSSKSWMITENTWFYDIDAQRLYVWKKGGGNPGTVEASTGDYGIYCNDKNYITIDGINVRYAKDQAIDLNNYAVDITGNIVRNCNVSYSPFGITIGRLSGSIPYNYIDAIIYDNTIDHCYINGVLSHNAYSPTITDNTITYSGGLYPQLPGGGSATIAAGIFSNGDLGTFLYDGNNISYTSQTGIVYECKNGTISNNIITNTSIYLSDAGGIYSAIKGSNVIITTNTLTNTGYGIYFDEVSDGGTVEHNIINEGATGMVWHRAFNITARFNKFTGPFTSGYIFAVNSSGTKVSGSTFTYNIIDGVDNNSVGINIAGDAAIENSLIDIQNNVIINCNIGLSILQDLPSVVDDIKNNIFYNNNTHIATASGNPISINYNLFGGTGNWIWGGSPKATFALWKTASAGDVNSINADPLFYSSLDFHLRPSSPCIGAGINVGLTTDYDGNTSKNPPSIGVYEYDSKPASAVMPVYQSSVVENTTPSQINIVYNLSLANTVPATSAFAVTVNSVARTVSSVAVSGTTVVLTLSSPVVYGDAVKVAYTKPSSNPLQTSAGGQAASFSAQTVTNNVQVSNSAPVVMVNYKSTTYSGFVNELNASGSYDPNKDNLTFSWVVPSNISVSSTTGSTIQYLSPAADATQNVQFVVNVSDGKTIQSKTIPVQILPYKPGLEVAEVIKVEASNYLSPNYPANIIDGNIGTMWASNGDNEWLLLELKTAFSVQHVDLAFQPGQKRESFFDILGSEDMTTWETILSKSNSCAFSGALQVFDFPSSKTDKEFKYITMIGHGNTTDAWNYISEFRIFGYKHKNPTSYEEQPVKIYPNPAYKFINIRIDETTLEPDFIRIINFSGSVVFQYKVNPDIKNFQIPINLIQGVYIVQVGSGDLTLFSQKLIIIN